ncbi:phosphatidylserine/phosphatidylglycerophosphate/cardiolipin synthase family protein [Variovorax sp. dw_308]|uniref:phospholipase D-like domain-containing protein n=1 Tax=Variovorax sp. dw_308 TaxID=2721546 RepID=UPI001C48F94D|nr:phospholipase D family protein [Variovorax sp. dw_308]
MSALPKQLVRLIALCLGIVLSALMTGCASLPGDVTRLPSQSLDGATPLTAVASASLPANEDVSGLRLLPDGGQALEARMALAHAAARTIDAQYYQIANDASGREFLHALARAADRGVRVRLLIDDLHAGGEDELLAGLAAGPNVEVRMFNPLAVRGGAVPSRVLRSLNEFARVNRRMHNKLFIVDNAFAISGGRNIGDAYFGRSQPANFIDMDVLAAGKVVREQSAVFDAYWNSEHAYPIQSLVATERLPQVARAQFDAWAQGGSDAGAQALAGQDLLGQGPVGAELASGRVELHLATVRVMADAPVKATHEQSLADGAVMSGNLELLQSARFDVLVTSPYFIPDTRMLDILQASTARKVRVAVLTNSLATTDEPLVHVGYSRYRDELLDMGVALYEMMPGVDAPQAAASLSQGSHGSVGRLHAKLAVVDHRWLSIGSMNMDRRSAHSNTEMGLVIDSPELAMQVATLLQREQLPRSYQLRMQPGTGRPRLQWVAPSDTTQPLVFSAEPSRNWRRQLGMSFTSFFVSEQLL